MDPIKFLELSKNFISTTDYEGYLRYVNPSFCLAHGMSKEELIGKKFWELIHPDDVDVNEKNFGRLLEDGHIANFENRHIRKNGDILHLSWIASCDYDENLIYAIGNDITAQKLAEEKIEFSEKKFSQHFNTMPECYMLINLIRDEKDEVIDLYYLDINPAFEKLTGQSKENLINKRAKEAFEVIDDYWLKVFDAVNKSGEPMTYNNFSGQMKGFYSIHAWKLKEDIIAITFSDISEQKKEKAEIIRNNKLLEASQAIAHVGGWELDLVTNELYWTAETYRIHDTSPEEFNPTEQAGVSYFLPDSQVKIKEALKAAKERGEGYDLELETYTTKGRLIYVRTNCEVTIDKGKPVKLTGTFQDITDRKINEEKIKESEANVSAVLNSMTSSVCVIDETGEILQVNDAWNEFGLSGGHNREQKRFSDYNYFDVCKADFENEDAKSVYHGLNSILKGEIDEFDYEYPCHAPDKEQWFLLRANLMKTKRKQIVISHIDITSRKNLENDQRKILEQFDLAIRAGKLGVWTLNLTSGILEWNDRQLEIYGLSRDEFEEGIDDWQKQLHPDDAEYATGKLSQVFDGESFYGVEFRIIRKSGEIRYIEASGVAVRDETNKPIQFIGINRDITELKHAEEQLKASKEKAELSEKYLDNIINNIGDAVFVKDEQSRLLLVNDSFCSLFQVSRDEAKGKALDKYVPPEELEHFLRIDKHLIETGEESIIEESLTVGTGETKIISTRKSRYVDFEGNKFLIGVSRDITERKRAEQALKASEEKFYNAFDNAPNPTSILNIKTGERLAVNNAFCKTFGYSKSELLDDNVKFSSLALNQDEFKEALNEILKNGSLYQYPIEMKTKSGDIKFMHVYGTRWHSGNDDIYVGTFLDVTEIKRSEQDLKNSEEKFSNAFENAPNPTSILNIQTGERLAVNHAFCETFGYSKSELLAGNIHVQNLMEDQKEIQVLMAKVLKAGSLYNHPAKMLTKSGELRKMLFNSTKLYPNNDDIHIVSLMDITAQKQQESALKESEARLQRAQKIAKLGSWYLDIKTNVVIWGEELFKMFGLDSTMPVPKWDEQQKYYTKGSWESLSAAVEKTSKEGVPYEIELHIIRKDKTTGWITSRGEALKNDTGEIYALSGVAQDITSRKHAERELRKLSTAVEQSPESIVITDTNGTIEYANPKFSEVSGYTLDEVIGKNPNILKSGHHDASFYKNMWKTLASGKVWNGEMLNKNKNGELYWERSNISPLINREGETTHYVAIKENISKEKKMLEELKESKEKAELANQLKDRFLANMSHEIRTPINGVIGFSELLKSDDLSAENRHQYLSIIEGNSKHLLSLISDIIDVAKMEANELKINYENCEVAKMIAELEINYNHLKSSENKSQIQFIAHVPEKLKNLNIITDSTRIRQVLANLLNNALKFSEKGVISFGFDVKGSELVFFVKDQGIGIAAENTSDIFERFKQIGLSQKSNIGGSGLGLAICKGIVALFGGSIAVKSELNVGTEFTFTIPLNEAISKKESKVESTLSTTSLEGKTLLIAEDGATARFFFKEILKPTKVKIIFANNGEMAVRLYNQHPEIDVVLMDIGMPIMDGFEASEKILKMNPKARIIIQSAYVMGDEKERCFAIGCMDYLTKPIQKDSLYNMLSKWIE